MHHYSVQVWYLIFHGQWSPSFSQLQSEVELTMLVQVLMKVLFILCMGQIIDTQSNGDVRLVPINDFEFEMQGRLEIAISRW